MIKFAMAVSMLVLLPTGAHAEQPPFIQPTPQEIAEAAAYDRGFALGVRRGWDIGFDRGWEAASKSQPPPRSQQPYPSYQDCVTSLEHGWVPGDVAGIPSKRQITRCSNY